MENNISSLKKIKYNLVFFINFFFTLFPISYICGNLFLNLNLLIFCLLGFLYLRDKKFYFQPDLLLKIMITFFLVILISTFLANIKLFKSSGLNILDTDSIFKSLFFLRFLFLIIIICLLKQYNAIKFEYFFYVAGLLSILIALDVIFQYTFGSNIVGLKGNIAGKNSSFFGEEGIAGAFIERFSFFSIFFIFYFAEKKGYYTFLLTSLTIYILCLGILFSGNRMPLILFLLGLIILFVIFKKFRKKIIFSLSIFLISFFLLSSNNQAIKDSFYSFYLNSKSILVEFSKNTLKLQNNLKLNIAEKDKDGILKELPAQSGHKYLFLTAVDTWKLNKIFGGGIKSFRKDCIKIIKVKPDRICSNHPHNYHLEILTETGIVGFFIFILFILFLLKYAFKTYLNLKEKSETEYFIFLASIICLILEFFPLRSTGSFFSTNNATYIALILSIMISSNINYKKSAA